MVQKIIILILHNRTWRNTLVDPSEKQKTKRLYVKTDSNNKKIRDYLDSVGIEMKIGDPD